MSAYLLVMFLCAGTAREAALGTECYPVPLAFVSMNADACGSAEAWRHANQLKARLRRQTVDTDQVWVPDHVGCERTGQIT